MIWTFSSNNYKLLVVERARETTKPVMTLSAVKESIVTGAVRRFPSVKVSVQNAVLGVSGRVDLAMLVGMSAIAAASRSTGAHLSTRNRKRAKMRRRNLKILVIQKVCCKIPKHTHSKSVRG